MNKKDVVELFKFLNAVYPKFEVTQEKLNAWAPLFTDQDFDEVMKKAQDHAMESRFVPTISELVTVKVPKKKDSRDMDIAFSDWMLEGNDPEEFDWLTGGRKTTKH